MKSRQNSRTFTIIFLGMLSAFGPFVMDMYLPTLPAMTGYFNTSSSMVQLGLTASMIGLAAGQLVFGPVSDKFGRRSSLLAAMILFLLSTAGCILSETILQFVALRLVQGIAGAGGVVISRSIAADKYAGHELAAMLAIIGAINGIATVAAPIAGGTLSEIGGWHGIFCFLLFLGVILLAGSFHFNESLSSEQRASMRWSNVFRRFRTVTQNRQYLCYILQYGLTMGVLFANIASAPFIMQQHYGLSPMEFSLCFGANAIAMVISSTVAVRFRNMKDALGFGSSAMLLLSTVLFVALYLGCNFWIYETLAFCLLAMVGMTFTASSALAMDCERTNAGIASALLGAIGFAFGGIVSPLAGLGNILHTAGLLFLAGSLLSHLCANYALARHNSTRRITDEIFYMLRRASASTRILRK